MWWTFILFLSVQANVVTRQDFLNQCVRVNSFQKKKPSPEDQLYGQCAPWRNLSCCSQDKALHVHQLHLYNFDLFHCPNTTFSDLCKSYFIRESCFTHCSPNTGPWITFGGNEEEERLWEVPLCRSECERWFEACRTSHTCSTNWRRNFDWRSGRNTCLRGSVCYPIQEVFSSATHFCQQVWDNAWRVVEDTEPCMRLSWQGVNPNTGVALHYADVLLHQNRASLPSRPLLFLGLLLSLPLL